VDVRRYVHRRAVGRAYRSPSFKFSNSEEADVICVARVKPPRTSIKAHGIDRADSVISEEHSSSTAFQSKCRCIQSNTVHCMSSRPQNFFCNSGTGTGSECPSHLVGSKTDVFEVRCIAGGIRAITGIRPRAVKAQM
jgi:hypothetical protein